MLFIRNKKNQRDMIAVVRFISTWFEFFQNVAVSLSTLTHICRECLEGHKEIDEIKIVKHIFL